eukprot:501753_1
MCCCIKCTYDNNKLISDHYMILSLYKSHNDTPTPFHSNENKEDIEYQINNTIYDFKYPKNINMEIIKKLIYLQLNSATAILQILNIHHKIIFHSVKYQSTNKYIQQQK